MHTVAGSERGGAQKRERGLIRQTLRIPLSSFLSFPMFELLVKLYVALD